MSRGRDSRLAFVEDSSSMDIMWVDVQYLTTVATVTPSGGADPLPRIWGTDRVPLVSSDRRVAMSHHRPPWPSTSSSSCSFHISSKQAGRRDSGLNTSVLLPTIVDSKDPSAVGPYRSSISPMPSTERRLMTRWTTYTRSLTSDLLPLQLAHSASKPLNVRSSN